MTLLATVLLASLVGSLHCAGMCGPLVAFAVGNAAAQSRSARASLHLAYHGGRLVSYALVGAAAGAVGAAIDLGANRLGVYRAATVLAAGLMIVVGLAAVARASGLRLPKTALPAALGRWIVSGQRAALALGPLPRAASVGLLSALLPCGWLWAWVMPAAGTGSAWQGAAIMAAFWLGTVPVLVSLGIGVQSLAAALGRRLPLASGVVVVALGVATLVVWIRGAEAVAAERIAAVRTGDPARQVEEARDATPACCRVRQGVAPASRPQPED